jgi:hypothetical protein
MSAPVVWVRRLGHANHRSRLILALGLENAAERHPSRVSSRPRPAPLLSFGRIVSDSLLSFQTECSGLLEERDRLAIGARRAFAMALPSLVTCFFVPFNRR